MRKFTIKILFVFFCCIGCVTIENSRYDLDTKMAVSMKPEFSIFHHNDLQSKIFIKIKTADLLYTRNDRTKPFNANLKLSYNLYTENGKTWIDSGSILWKDFYTINKKEFIDTVIPFDLKLNQLAKLKLSITDLNRFRTYERLVDVNKKDFYHRQFYLLEDTNNQVLLNNYYTGSKYIRITNNYITNKIVYVNYNDINFPVALPPFSKASRQSFPKATGHYKRIDFNKNTNLVLPENGFVYFQIDTLKNQGFSLFNFNPHFPYLKEPKQLIGPLRFLCTKEEFKKIAKSSAPKNTVDQFWLSKASSMERARNLIKTYYSRVEKANEMFTSHLEGWKTDRGMISIIFGPPIYIRKTKSEEIWYYGQQSNSNLNAYNSLNDPMRIQSSGLKFTFDKVSNPFSMNDYELDRNYSYKSSWYRAVESWRKGKVYIVQ
jgi:GWxTD domain-containing protein